MIIYSIIQKSQLEGAHRLDAEYYKPEYLELNKKLKSTNVKLLSELAFVKDGIHASINYDSDSGIRCFSAGAVKDNFFDEVDIFISAKQNQANKKTILKSGDIILSSVGTIGNAAVVDEKLLPANADRHVAIIRLKDKVISPYYLSTFLNSKYGKFQSIRESTGNVQLNLFLDKLEHFLIPYLSPEKVQIIEEITKQAHFRFEDSKSLYSQAENLLLEELGLKSFQADEELWSIVNFSDVKTADRIDAEYFQPKYEKLIFKLKALKARKLEDILENVSAKFSPPAQPGKSFKYVELSNINASIGVIDGFFEVLGKEAPSRAKRVLKSGDVIVSSVEGSLGKVALVDKEQEGYLASTGFFQFRSEELLPEVILVLAKSFIVKNQLEQRCAGTILTAVPKESIKDILIPILPKPIQQKIADLVQKSHEARKKSRELLEEAKHKVEEMIEK